MQKINLKKLVREIITEIQTKKRNLNESKKSYYDFNGKLKFNDYKNITDSYLDRNFSGSIGGDQGDIEDFQIYIDGKFSGTLVSYHDDLNSDDVSNIVDIILSNYDENTNKIIDRIIDVSA